MSNRSEPVARVYAAALIEIGRATGTLGTVYDDLQAVQRLVDGDAWFRSFFTSPRIDRTLKWNALREAFEGRVCRPVLGLLKVLVGKGREPIYDNVVDQFHRFKDLAENRVHAYVVVARALPPDVRASLQGRLEKASGKNVEIHEKVEPSALGGVSIRIGDRVIDRTLRTRLDALRRHLLAANA